MYPIFCEDAIRLLRSRKMCRTYSEGAYNDLERYSWCGIQTDTSMLWALIYVARHIYVNAYAHSSLDSFAWSVCVCFAFVLHYWNVVH